MKSFTKRILAAGLALAVVTGVSGAAVFADSSAPQTTDPSTLCGAGVSGKSDMKYNTAFAYTSYGSYADSLSVVSTYTYWDNMRGMYGTQVKSSGHYNYARVDFTAPRNCKSVNISSSHRVARNHQVWTADTFDDKEA